MKIPKIIWIYWNNPYTLPLSVKYNISKIKSTNPDFVLILLNQKNFRNYVDMSMFNFNKGIFSTPQYFSDLLRIFLISKYGGIWIDSTLLVWKNLSKLVNLNDELVFFENKHNSKKGTLALESWFIAAIPNHPFINKLKEIVISLNTSDKIEIFLNKTLKKNQIKKQWNTWKEYHLIYHVLNFTCQKYPNYLNNIRLHNSDNAYVGHFPYLPKPIYGLNYTYLFLLIASFILKKYIKYGEPKNIIVTKIVGQGRKLLEKRLM